MLASGRASPEAIPLFSWWLSYKPDWWDAALIVVLLYGSPVFTIHCDHWVLGYMADYSVCMGKQIEEDLVV